MVAVERRTDEPGGVHSVAPLVDDVVGPRRHRPAQPMPNDAIRQDQQAHDVFFQHKHVSDSAGVAAERHARALAGDRVKDGGSVEAGATHHLQC